MSLRFHDASCGTVRGMCNVYDVANVNQPGNGNKCYAMIVLLKELKSILDSYTISRERIKSLCPCKELIAKKLQ